MLKESLKNGSFAIGTWCDLPSPAVINVLSKAGLDFVIIDMEHGPMDFKVAQEMAFAAESEGKEALIRVPRLDESDILRALDSGASGIIVPHIETVKDRENVIKFSKYPPSGNRGFNPYVRCGGYKRPEKDYCDVQNKNNLIGLMLEGRQALNDLERIIDDPGVDIVYIGTYDLSVALGLGGDISHPDVIKQLESAVSKIKKAGKIAGCMIHDSAGLKRFKELGIQFICYKVDSAMIHDAVSGIIQELKNDRAI